MHSQHRRRRTTAGYLTTAVCLTALCLTTGTAAGTAAQADPPDDTRSVDRAADRAAATLEDVTARARTAALQLGSAMHALPIARRRVADTRGGVIAALVLAGTARRRADAARVRYRRTAIRAARAQRRLARARARVDQLVTDSYQGSRFVALNLLTGATGPQDMLDRLGYVGQVLHTQQSDVDEFTVAGRAARDAQDQAAAAAYAAEQAGRAALDSLGAARVARRAALRARAMVLRLTASRRRALWVARSERVAVLARYRALRAEEARIAAALRRWTHRQRGAASLGGLGRLLMPVRGWKSSDFGMRLNPVYRVWRLHAGTDFAAADGAPIRAAADGRVVNAGWSGGYGNYTCISHGQLHGQGLSTCYGHQSAILVGVGQQVRRGQIIGRVGTTGASTGYHLHFEVRLDGTPHNPLAYLPGCLC